MMNILNKFDNLTATIGIIGLGYVGLPLLLRFSEVGYKVTGFDIDNQKTDKLNQGQSYIEHISSRRIIEALENNFEATTDFSKIIGMDAIILCLPTPLNKYREPDLSFVNGSLEIILPFLKKGQIISLESTTYPGTTEEELKPKIESTGLKIGQDVFLVYSPEREDPGNKDFETKTIPKVIGGDTENCISAGKALYQKSIDNLITVSSTKAAEMTKLLENIHRSVNIGLVNEMKIVADRMGIDIHEVIRAASSKPFGYTPFFPGPGLGGHCIPIDPFYLTWKAREYGISTRFIELAGEVNTNMPRWVLEKIIDSLNMAGKSASNSRVLILGIAYKKNVDDMRESPSIELIKLLNEKGSLVDYSDPHIPFLTKLSNLNLNMYESISLDAKAIQNYDVLVLATDHDKFDYVSIQKNAKLIIDTRGVYTESYNNVVKA